MSWFPFSCGIIGVFRFGVFASLHLFVVFVFTWENSSSILKLTNNISKFIINKYDQ